MAVKSSLGQLHLALMEQLERVSTASQDELESEIKRSEAMSELGKTIVSNAGTILRVAKLQNADQSARLLASGEIDG